MGRTVIASQNLEEYLVKCADEMGFCYGLIIGQPSLQNKDYVVHLTKTSNDIISIKEPEEDEPPRQNKEEGNISSEALIHHLVSATRMIPGSFFVLGVFVVDSKDLFTTKECLKDLKNCLRQFNSALKNAKYGNIPAQINEEKLVLFYSSQSRTTVCKSYIEKLDQFAPAEWKFVKNPTEWHLFESSYEFDDIFPLTETEDGINIERNFSDSLDNMSLWIGSSEIFIQNEKVDDSTLLENYIKSKKIKSDEDGSFKASLFLPELISSTEPVKMEKYQGTIKFSGTLSSRIWSHPKNSFKDIERYIRNDILRSLAARVQIYCDSLNNATASRDAFISEPPRRVYFHIPDSGGIQCSEYLFRNELAEVAVEQAKEILDLDIQAEDVIMDTEGLPELDDCTSIVTEASIAKGRSATTEISKYMYMAGIATALLVLIISLLLHYVIR